MVRLAFTAVAQDVYAGDGDVKLRFYGACNIVLVGICGDLKRQRRALRSEHRSSDKTGFRIRFYSLLVTSKPLVNNL